MIRHTKRHLAELGLIPLPVWRVSLLDMNTHETNAYNAVVSLARS